MPEYALKHSKTGLNLTSKRLPKWAILQAEELSPPNVVEWMCKQFNIEIDLPEKLRPIKKE